MKRIVVFGATGTLGAHIAVHLKRIGYDVVATGHRKNDNGFFQEIGIPYYSVDISDYDTFSILPQKDIFAVLNFAGALPASMEGYNADLYFKTIVCGTHNVLEYTKTVGGDKII